MRGEAVLRRALEIMFEKVDEEECAECPIGKTCQGEVEECIEHHIQEASEGK